MESSKMLHINGNYYELKIEQSSTLLELLRNKFDLKSVRRSCEEGECGACTVLVNGNPVYSCLMMAHEALGKKITTCEGLIKNDKLHPLMQAFIDNYGLQCGFCTSGIIMTSYALLNQYDQLTDEAIKISLSGHLCRCTGYVNIIESIKKAKSEKEKGNWW